MKDSTKRKFDLVMVWSIDRLGRSLQNLMEILNDLKSKNIDLYMDQQAIDTTTPTGSLMFAMIGAFAEFERSMIRERVLAGLDRARSQGKRLGRPPVPPILIEKMKRMRGEGMTLTAIAKKVGVSVGKVHQCV